MTGIHNNPIRALTYMDLSSAAMMGLSGGTNYLVVKPSPGVAADDVKLALMNQPGVASVQAISEFSQAFEDAMDLFTAVLRIVQIIVLVMAFLIAFNSTSINVDERVREICHHVRVWPADPHGDADADASRISSSARWARSWAWRWDGRC